MKTCYAYIQNAPIEYAQRMHSKNRKIANRFESKLIEFFFFFFDLFRYRVRSRTSYVFHTLILHMKNQKVHTFFGPKTEKCISYTV